MWYVLEGGRDVAHRPDRLYLDSSCVGLVTAAASRDNDHAEAGYEQALQLAQEILPQGMSVRVVSACFWFPHRRPWDMLAVRTII